MNEISLNEKWQQRRTPESSKGRKWKLKKAVGEPSDWRMKHIKLSPSKEPCVSVTIWLDRVNTCTKTHRETASLPLRPAKSKRINQLCEEFGQCTRLVSPIWRHHTKATGISTFLVEMHFQKCWISFASVFYSLCGVQFETWQSHCESI